MKNRPHIAIVGAGAAGCFCGALLGELLPGADVTVFESGRLPMAKLAITGGGRCNITNTFKETAALKAYPRGGRLMEHLLKGFGPDDVCRWFGDRGVKFVCQEDQCIFPASQDAMQIVRTLKKACEDAGVKIRCSCPVTGITPGKEGGFALTVCDGEVIKADIAVITVGGLSSAKLCSVLKGLDIELVKPVPSLFTLKTESTIKELAGAVVNPVKVSLEGTKLSAIGPLLITDWGFSGPAVLKLSSYAARDLADSGYKGTIAINWMYDNTEDEVMALLEEYSGNCRHKNIASVYPPKLTSRLWNFIINKADIKENVKFAELTAKSRRRLCSTLLHDTYPITGRGRFKDEFVTCGGVPLGQVNSSTLESRTHPGLYFAGEVLDIDAVTGGFNLQAAWTTAHRVANSIKESI